MGIEITFTSTHHRVQRNDATRIQVRLQSHQRLFQVKGWSPAEGLIEEPLELSHEIVIADANFPATSMGQRSRCYGRTRCHSTGSS